MSYIFVDIYRDGLSDSTLNGVTSNKENIFAVPSVRGNISDNDVLEYGYIVLEQKPPVYSGCPIRFSVKGEKRHSMAGGNFAYTSDSRFSETYCDYPISVHDRIED